MKKINLIIFLILYSCKPMDFNLSTWQKLVQSIWTEDKNHLPLKKAVGKEEIETNKVFYQQIWTESYETKFASLPTQGEVPDDKKPYSDFWYPEKFGGTNVPLGEGVSALAKYDLAFNNGQPLAQNWENQNHYTAPNDPTSGWAGHCNGFAAASQRHREPMNAVSMGSAVFTSQDIKALLAEINMSANYYFLGGDRCQSQSVPTVRNRTGDVTRMGTCEDTNPALFHLSLTNWIGIKKHTILFDEFSGEQVWNYPIYKFEMTESATLTSDKSKALQWVTGKKENNYLFNPEATQFAYIKMKITFANALSQIPSESSGRTLIPDSKSYEYILELNESGSIIGGEWVGQSQTLHPDFLWIAFEPFQSNGEKKFGNPHVDVKKVIELWAKSIGADPNNPPSDIKMPNLENSWGVFQSFTVRLDGNSQGSVFLGKPTKTEIARRNELAGPIDLYVKLNGVDLSVQKLDQNSNTIFEINPSVGLNRLTFTWKRNGTEVGKETSLRFVALP